MDGADDEQRPQRPTVCLTMIVRDAATFIGETLACVTPEIDTWLIVDTGSVDETRAAVEAHFRAAGIGGTLVHRPWIGFAHNRTEALALARGRADVALMVDADDLLVGRLPLDQLDAEADAYRLRFGPDHIFWRPGVFRLDRTWEFRGAVHEYAVCLDGTGRTENLLGDYHMVFRSLGGRSKDTRRFQRDIDALTASWEEQPDEPRTAFYLGQSYRDAGDLDAAIEWYRRRASMRGWDEETFIAALEVARCMERRGDSREVVVAAYENAHSRRPKRAEPLHDLARFHRLRTEWADGYRAACRATTMPFPHDDLLFVNADVYRWRIDDERAVCAYHLGLYDETADLCDRLLASPHVPLHERERVLANRDLALAYLIDLRVSHRPERVAALTNRLAAGRAGTAEGGVTLTITTCRRRRLFERTIDSFLECCTDHDRITRWVCIDDGSTVDDLRLMRERYPFFEFVVKEPGDRGHASSMNELLRLVDTPYWLHLEDDWDFVAKGALIEHLVRTLDDDPALLQVVVNRNYAETLEHRTLAGGEFARTSEGGFPYRRHVHHPAGSDELATLLAANPGRLTNAHWPGFSLMPSLIRRSAAAQVGAFDAGSGHFELDYARRAANLGWRVAFLDTIVCVTTGKLRNDHGHDAPPNAYALSGRPQFEHHPDITVGLLANWTSGSALARQWRRQFPSAGAWRGVRLVDPSETGVEPDYWFVVNHPPEGISTPPERTIVAHMEPAVGVASYGAWASPDENSYLQVRSHRSFPNVIEWHLDATYDELRVAPITPTRLLSAIVTSKRLSPGHHLRLDLLHAIEAAGAPIDIFGTDNAEGFINYHGALPPHDKREGLMPYRYTITAENHAEVNYFTEKIVDAVLSETLCFYWGCPNLHDHIDPDAFIRLPMHDLDEGVRMIRAAIENDEYSRRLPAIRRAKRRLLDEQQLAPTLSRVVRGARFADSLDLHVVNLDRRPDRLAAFDSRLFVAAGERLSRRRQRFSAFDGADLELTDDIAHMFRGSELPLRRAQTACAISHLALWWAVATGDGNPALIFEDDAEPVAGFNGRLVEVCGTLMEPGAEPGVVFLGLAHRSPEHAPVSSYQRVVPLNTSGVMGGAFAYIITQHGARRLWEIAQRDGIPCAIDTFVLRHAHEVDVRQAVPALVTAPVARRSGPIIDSDIQYDPHRL